MLYKNRDLGIKNAVARDGHSCYGMGLGVMILDEVYPGFPGDIRNASAYPFPIQYDIIKNVSIDDLVFKEDKSRCLEPILESAFRLQKMGCRAIVAECGYFAYFQKEVSEQLDIPVFMSSLLQVPIAQQVVGINSKVGIVCGTKSQLLDRHLTSSGVSNLENIVIAGAMDEYKCLEFTNLWNEKIRPKIPHANYEKSERDMISMCKDFVERNPDIKALVFECTGFQPFARAVQREVNLPIFSWSTLLDFIYSVVVHREHYGHI